MRAVGAARRGQQQGRREGEGESERGEKKRVGTGKVLKIRRFSPRAEGAVSRFGRAVRGRPYGPRLLLFTLAYRIRGTIGLSVCCDIYSSCEGK